MPIDVHTIDFNKFIRCTFNLANGNKVRGRTVQIRGEEVVQLEYSENGNIRHTNLSPDKVRQTLTELLENVTTAEIAIEGRTYRFRRTKKGNLLSSSSPNTETRCVSPNDRIKNRILNGIVPALVEVGIMNAEGRVYNDKQEKFRQIDRFTELIADALSQEKRLKIVDFGCGKSYLGFAVEHYCRMHGIAAEIVGIDRKESVIENCRTVAQKCGIQNMTFVYGDIADYPLASADAVIALHACDTATDYALYNAARANVKYIFSVPCCQHELNQTMVCDNLLGKYGIIRERAAALVTDAVRAALLESVGYRVQVLEYIDSEHSLKNLMLRCVKANVSPAAKAQAKTQAETLLAQFGANTQTLYKLLYAPAPETESVTPLTE